MLIRRIGLGRSPPPKHLQNVDNTNDDVDTSCRCSSFAWFLGVPRLHRLDEFRRPGPRQRNHCNQTVELEVEIPLSLSFRVSFSIGVINLSLDVPFGSFSLLTSRILIFIFERPLAAAFALRARKGRMSPSIERPASPAFAQKPGLQIHGIGVEYPPFTNGPEAVQELAKKYYPPSEAYGPCHCRVP